ncbi:type VI secretion system baseplate subunit TssF [Spirobacillus cienkowskii]|uniref:type VI secretion system baseplate subunit TssF n=1 Tax=Spirobacillus cienkowskii TaxID=495820 RepID=UPI0030CA92F2
MSKKNDSSNFLNTYLNTLNNLRNNGKIFSQENPEIASHLNLAFRQSNDPETERLIESFAYMFANVESKSFLFRNEYFTNFIEGFFPELNNKIPALSVLKISLDKSIFSKEKFVEKIPKSTLFSCKNSNGINCFFTSLDPEILPASMLVNSNFKEINSITSRHAIELNFEMFCPVSVSQDHPYSIPLYIDSDFNTSLEIFEALFSSEEPIQVFLEDEKKYYKISRDSLSHNFNNLSHGMQKNYLYFFYDFINYYQKYFFFKLNLNIPCTLNKKFKILIPIKNKELTNFQRIENQFIQSHCIPVVNIFEKKLKPIKCNNEKNEYELKIADYLEENTEILKLNSVVTYDSNSGESIAIPSFYDLEENSSLKVWHSNLYWSTRKTFLDHTENNYSIFLKIFSLKEEDKNSNSLVDYFFPTADCTNADEVNNIAPNTQFQCHYGVISYKKIQSLFWPKCGKRPLVGSNSIEALHILLKLNYELLSQKILNPLELVKIIDFICNDENPIKSLIKNILFNSNGFSSEEIIKQKVIGNQSFYVPGILYKLKIFNKNINISGVHFFINFLNYYFDQIKDFNNFVKFEVDWV